MVTIKEKKKKKLKGKVTSKTLLKKSQTIVTIKPFEAPSILGDPNRFFQEKREEVRNNLFFE